MQGSFLELDKEKLSYTVEQDGHISLSSQGSLWGQNKSNTEKRHNLNSDVITRIPVFYITLSNILGYFIYMLMNLFLCVLKVV